MRKLALAAGLAVGLAACGGSDERYLSLSIGSTWTYRVTDPANGTIETKSSTVEAFEDVGGAKAGVMAFRVRTEKTNGYTISWQEDTGASIVRHREQSFDGAGALKGDEVYVPSKLRVDEESLSVGAQLTDSYQEIVTDAAGATMTTNKNDVWTVVATDEEVVVPAGTFTTLHLHRVNTATGSDKHFWFARGVGKVKETGGQTEELVSYTSP